jgi:hypothetical protein
MSLEVGGLFRFSLTQKASLEAFMSLPALERLAIDHLFG